MKGHKEADCRKKNKPAAAPAAKLKCNYCGKDGHKEADCYSKKNCTPRATPAARASSKKNDHKVCMFLKGLLGVLLAACCLFLPLLNTNYRSIFFDNPEIRQLKSIQKDIENNFVLEYK